MRIISHTCSNTEIVCALGCAELLVGVDDHSDYPETVVKSLPTIGPDLDFDIQRIIKLKPDLVLTSMTVPGHERNIEQLIKHCIPHVIMQPKTLQDIANDMRRIADLLGVSERGERLAEQFTTQLIDTAEATQVRPKILVEWWPKPVIVPGQHSWVTPLVALAGGINPLATDAVESRPVSDTELTEINPDAIVISWCGVPFDKYRTDVVYRRPCLQSSTILSKQRVFPVSEAYLGRPGPRLIQGLAELRRIVNMCQDKPR